MNEWRASKKNMRLARTAFGEDYKVTRLKNLAQTLVKEAEALNSQSMGRVSDTLNFYEEVKRLEIEMIRYALQRTNGHQGQAAQLLRLKATTLHSKIKNYGIGRASVESLDSQTR